MKEFTSQEAAVRFIEKQLGTLRIAEHDAIENARHRPEYRGFDRPTYETALTAVAGDIEQAISYITDEDVKAFYQEKLDRALTR